MTDALERLIEAVAAGTADWPTFALLLPSEDIRLASGVRTTLASAAFSAFKDDHMTAAIAVQKAILPNHDWGRAPSGQMWVLRPPAAPVWSGDGYPPARGLLLALLRAKLAEHVSETGIC